MKWNLRMKRRIFAISKELEAMSKSKTIRQMKPNDQNYLLRAISCLNAFGDEIPAQTKNKNFTKRSILKEFIKQL